MRYVGVELVEDQSSSSDDGGQHIYQHGNTCGAHCDRLYIKEPARFDASIFAKQQLQKDERAIGSDFLDVSTWTQCRNVAGDWPGLRRKCCPPHEGNKMTLRKLLLGTVAALTLAISPAYATDATDAQLHTPLPGYYHSQDSHTFHIDDDGSYQFDRALLCECIKKGKPNSKYVRELTFRCQGHPYPNVKPITIISKEKSYATTLDGKLFLTTVSDSNKNISI